MTAPNTAGIRISNFEFRIFRPQTVSSNWNLQSAWRCCGGPRREGRETWSAGARQRARWPRIADRSRGLEQQRQGRRSRRADLGVDRTERGPRNRSAAEIPRSRRDWASGCVSPTGARRDRSRDRPDRVEGGKRGQRSGIGAGWARGSPPARRRRAAGEVDGSDESLLSEETLAEPALPRSKIAAGGRAQTRVSSLRPPSGVPPSKR